MHEKKMQLLFFDSAGMRGIMIRLTVKECEAIKTVKCLQLLSRIGDRETGGNNY